MEAAGHCTLESPLQAAGHCTLVSRLEATCKPFRDAEGRFLDDGGEPLHAGVAVAGGRGKPLRDAA